MPISRDQFDAVLAHDMVQWMKLIHQFLSEHKEQAYTEEELQKEARPRIRDEVVVVWRADGGAEEATKKEPGTDPHRVTSGPVRKEELPTFRAALAKLAEVKAVEKKQLAGVRNYTYYAYKQELPNLE